MSAVKDSSIKNIYVQLLNEGTSVMRPTKGIEIGENLFKVLTTEDYDSNVEEWEFPPGTFVRCRKEIRNGEEILVATHRVDV
mgnify:CR=1 FL=1